MRGSIAISSMTINMWKVAFRQERGETQFPTGCPAWEGASCGHEAALTTQQLQ